MLCGAQCATCDRCRAVADLWAIGPGGLFGEKQWAVNQVMQYAAAGSVFGSELAGPGLQLFEFSPCERASAGPGGEMFDQVVCDLIGAICGEVLFQAVDSVDSSSVGQS